MQSIIIDGKYAQEKIEKVLQDIYPDLSYGTLQKAFRKKDIKANGTRVSREYIVMPGDQLDIYIVDDLLNGVKSTEHPEDTNMSDYEKRTGGTSGNSPCKKRINVTKGFSVVYEDENILLVNKEPGMPVHPDKEQTERTLIDLAREYLKCKDSTPLTSNQFQPELCHRLDRNTGGLVIIAKNQASYDIILKKLEAREIRKFYQCLVKGKLIKKEDQLKAYLWKDARKSQVFINHQKTKGAVEIITGYKVLEYNAAKDVSHLEVELITGRTHQIRAHMAFIGHPIIGDGKYGTNEINRAFGLKQQALWACRIKFAFKGSTALLGYLNGKEFFVNPGFTKQK